VSAPFVMTDGGEATAVPTVGRAAEVDAGERRAVGPRVGHSPVFATSD
jgi:hypothetical protein